MSPASSLASMKNHQNFSRLSHQVGAYNEWKANAIGRNASSLREFLEKKWEQDMDDEKTVRLAIETLLEVVENC